MNKPNIIIILNRLVIGGQAVDTIPLAYYLQQYFNVLILYGEKETDEVEASFLLQQYTGLQLKKIKHLKRTINPIADIIAFIEIVKQIKLFKATVVHTHGSKSGLLGRLAAKYLSVQVIVHTFHGHLFHSYFNSFGTWLLIQVEKFLAKISTHIIALSEKQKNELVQQYKIVSSNKIHVIPLGIDENNFIQNDSSKRENFRAKFHLKESDIAVGLVGRVVPIKNHQLFVDIAEQVINNNQYQHIYFFIIGDGSGMQTLMDNLDKRSIEYHPKYNSSRIIFTSWVEDMIWAYYGLDIVMLTSLNEGTPLSIIEAQLCGKPVIATDVGGVKDTFLPSKSGFLVEGYEKENYIQPLLQLVNDTQLMQQMSDEAVKFATHNFAKQKEVEAVKELYLHEIG
ncbi:MAG: glycosyltransferase [Chitinophagaceae bacterium]|nr:glycosyltransferase [Chitinophagaceae bacterium]MCW5905697.1 glycosyltransferase [Chitinophagaceae bacterium]